MKLMSPFLIRLLTSTTVFLAAGLAMLIGSHRVASGDWIFIDGEEMAPQETPAEVPEVFLFPSLLPEGYRLSGLRLYTAGEDDVQYAHMNFTSDQQIDQWLYMYQFEGQLSEHDRLSGDKVGSAVIGDSQIDIFQRESEGGEYLRLLWDDPSRGVVVSIHSRLTLDKTRQIAESMQ